MAWTMRLAHGTIRYNSPTFWGTGGHAVPPAGTEGSLHPPLRDRQGFRSALRGSLCRAGAGEGMGRVAWAATFASSDCYEGSAIIGVSPRRSSRVPFALRAWHN